MATTFSLFQQRQLTALLRRYPDLATTLGARDMEGGLPSGSPDAIRERVAFYQDWVAANRRWSDAELTAEERFDRDLFASQFEMFRFVQLDLARWRLNPDAFEGLGSILFCMLLGSYPSEEQRFNNIRGVLEDIPRYLGEFRQRIEHPEPEWQRLALQVAAGMPTLFNSIVDACDARLGGTLAAEVRQLAETATRAAQEQRTWLESLVPGTPGAWHLSEENFSRLLQLKGIPLTTQELLHVGVHMLATTHRRRKELASLILPGETPHAVNTWLNTQAPATFQEGLDSVRRAVKDARQFIKDRRLSSLFEGEELVVVETPAFFAPLVPFAAILPAARMDTPQRGIYMVTPGADGDLSDLAEGRLAGVAVHEGYPGHHLQLATANARTNALRTGVFGGLFEDGVSAWGVDLVEGWAHYCEDMMPEQGFRNTPVTRFVQANDQLWRACRIVVDVELSRGKMSPEEAVHLLVRETDMPEPAARAEVDRYTTSPTYQLCYLTGKLLLLALREEAREVMGDKFSLGAFHDFVMGAGNMPVTAARRLLYLKHGREVPEHPLLDIHALAA